MNVFRQNEDPGRLSEAEETLRLIAAMRAPDGLVERVQAGLRDAPREARLLRWPVPFDSGGFMYGRALRGVAAAAIVCLVAGGAWQIYTHVQPAPPVQMAPAAAPARISGGGGFSSAGAMRTPDSPSGPVLTHTLTPPAQAATPAVKTPEHARKAAKKHKTAAPAAVPQP